MSFYLSILYYFASLKACTSSPHARKTIVKSYSVFAGINKMSDLDFYNACQIGKNCLQHFDSVFIKAKTPLQLLYANL